MEPDHTCRARLQLLMIAELLDSQQAQSPRYAPTATFKQASRKQKGAEPLLCPPASGDCIRECRLYPALCKACLCTRQAPARRRAPRAGRSWFGAREPVYSRAVAWVTSLCGGLTQYTLRREEPSGDPSAKRVRSITTHLEVQHGSDNGDGVHTLACHDPTRRG